MKRRQFFNFAVCCCILLQSSAYAAPPKDAAKKWNQQVGWPKLSFLEFEVPQDFPKTMIERINNFLAPNASS